MILAAVAAFAGATLQSATGFGLVLVLGPALFATVEPEEALTVLFVLSAVLNLLVLAAERREREVRADQLTVILGAALPGVVLGVLILQAIAKPALQVIVGVAVVLAAMAQVQGARLASSGTGAGAPSYAPALVGLLTGILTTSTGTSGPPMVLWFQRLGFSPHAMRDTLAGAFFVLNVIGAAALFTLGEDPGLPGAASVAVLLVLAIAGYLMGRVLFEGLDPRHFHTAGLLLVVGAGIASVAAGLSG